MRKALRTGVVCAAAAFALAAGTARAAVIEFNSPDDLANFSQRLGGNAGVDGIPVATQGFQYAATAGRTGSGAITHAAGGSTDLAAVYQGETFDLTAGTNSLAGFFKTPAAVDPSGTGAVFQLGFSANNNTALYGETGHNFISTRVNQATSAQNAYRLQTQTKTAGGTTQTPNLGPGTFTLDPNTWYRLANSFTRSATPDTFDFSTTLENWGADGSSLVSVVAGPFTGTVTNADIYNDTTTFAAFRSVETRVAQTIDSFTAVPEPSSALALMGGLGLLAGSRRRRSA